MRKKIILVIVIALIVGFIWYFEVQKPDIGLKNSPTIEIGKIDKIEKAKKYDPAIELVGNQEFLNSPSTGSGQGQPFKLADYIGKKVILIDFWTYSCINCQRTLPYLNSWWEQYEDDGLLIVGVHTPEFEFEKDVNNLTEAIKKFSIKYPVVQDNDYSTWRAYGNRYWPRKYLIDIDGFIVYDHIGEGAYEETENKIRELLEERKIVLNESGEIDKNTSNPQNIQDISVRPDSPEVYFGAARNELLYNGIKFKAGIQEFKRSSTITKNKLYLLGSWDIQNEYARNIEAGGGLIFKFDARQVNIVAESDNPVTIRVILDGKELNSVKIHKSQLYELINLSDKGEYILELFVNDPNVRIYTFTFG